MIPSRLKHSKPLQIRNARPHTWLKSNPAPPKPESSGKTAAKKKSG